MTLSSAAPASSLTTESSSNSSSIGDPNEPNSYRHSSVLEAKQDSNRFREERLRRDALTGLERCAGSVVAEMVQGLEACNGCDSSTCPPGSSSTSSTFSLWSLHPGTSDAMHAVASRAAAAHAAVVTATRQREAAAADLAPAHNAHSPPPLDIGDGGGGTASSTASASAASGDSWQNANMGVEEAQLRLVLSLFPSFTELHRKLCQADVAFARQCVTTFTVFVRGPPNRPTRDRGLLLPLVLNFLDDLPHPSDEEATVSA